MNPEIKELNNRINSLENALYSIITDLKSRNICESVIETSGLSQSEINKMLEPSYRNRRAKLEKRMDEYSADEQKVIMDILKSKEGA